MCACLFSVCAFSLLWWDTRRDCYSRDKNIAGFQYLEGLYLEFSLCNLRISCLSFCSPESTAAYLISCIDWNIVNLTEKRIKLNFGHCVNVAAFLPKDQFLSIRDKTTLRESSFEESLSLEARNWFLAQQAVLKHSIGAWYINAAQGWSGASIGQKPRCKSLDQPQSAPQFSSRNLSVAASLWAQSVAA